MLPTPPPPTTTKRSREDYTLDRPPTYPYFGELTKISAEWYGALIVHLVAQVTPEQFQCLRLVRYLLVAGPVEFVDVGDALHQRLRRRLHLTCACSIVLQLLLQPGRRGLLLVKVILVDFEQFIGCAILFAKILHKLDGGERNKFERQLISAHRLRTHTQKKRNIKKKKDKTRIPRNRLRGTGSIHPAERVMCDGHHRRDEDGQDI